MSFKFGRKWNNKKKKIAKSCLQRKLKNLVFYLIICLFSRAAVKQSPAGKDASSAAAAAKLAKEQELEQKVLEPREKEPLMRAQHDSSGYFSFLH